MLTYNLDSLGWYNFERLTGALMREILGAGVEAFGGSKDNGRDCIFRGKAPYPSLSEEWEGDWIIQVKYSNSSQVGALNSEKAIQSAFLAEIVSIQKRRRLSFHNYLFVTNVPISGDGRDKLEKLFLSKHPSAKFRIIDGKDVCDLLVTNQSIRQSFPQLLGLADLSKILNRDIYEKAEAFLELAKQETAAFVRHSHYESALEVLTKKNFVVLDGPPEVGKTTIAYAIALRYAASGHHVIDISGSSDAFFKAYDINQPALFIADDAVGSITFESDLGEMWARDLAKMIIKLGSKHKLVWTTRRYILEDALARTKLNEVVSSFPKDNDVLISVDQYTYMERAEMLYNHTKIRVLSETARLAIKKSAWGVIGSNDFTPLRIKQFLDDVLPDCEQNGMSVENISQQFIEYCKNPNARWSKAFDNLSDTERILLISLIDCGGNATNEDLKNSFNIRCNELDLPVEFDRCVQKLRNSFIKDVAYFEGNFKIQFQHPSVRDMVLRRVHSDDRSKLQYIKLASLSSIISIINSLFENPNNSDSLHEVVVDSIAAKDELISRIKKISNGAIEATRWSALLITSKVLADQVKKSNIKETQIAIVKEVINEVISVTCSNEFFLKHQNWSPNQWNQVVDGLIKILSSSFIKSEGPKYWTDLSLLFAEKADFLDGINFVAFASKWVPGIIQREMNETIMRWKEEAENDAQDCLKEAPSEGEDCPEPEFNEWWERSNPTLKSLIMLQELDFIYDSNLIMQLDKRHDNIIVVKTEEDDYEPSKEDKESWSIQKLLDDI
ncbi:MAG: restriction endonuclease [Bacteroidia bacterium]